MKNSGAAKLKSLCQEMPRIWMGILNVTPDSFSDGGLYYRSPEKTLLRAQELIAHGAKIIDVGGLSTRPVRVYQGAETAAVSPQEELERVLESLTLLRNKLPRDILISLDTYSPFVAEEIAKRGLIDIINDVYGGRLVEAGIGTTMHVAANNKCAFIAMHMQGTPQMMQFNPHYSDCPQEIFDFFMERVHMARQLHAPFLVLDPGIGFGKTLEHNMSLLSVQTIKKFQSLSLPLLYGLSRKNFLKTKFAQTRCEAFSCVDLYVKELEAECLQNGVQIIRTHVMPSELYL